MAKNYGIAFCVREEQRHGARFHPHHRYGEIGNIPKFPLVALMELEANIPGSLKLLGTGLELNRYGRTRMPKPRCWFCRKSLSTSQLSTRVATDRKGCECQEQEESLHEADLLQAHVFSVVDYIDLPCSRAYDFAWSV
jgi:hypothetical protein